MLTRIESGQWLEDSQIPTEEELCQLYGVSTITIREALKQLVNDGVLLRRAGKGTFVTKPRLIQHTSSLFSIARWHTGQKGIDVTTRIIKIEMQPCDDQIAAFLRLSAGTEVTNVERLRLGNNVPLMFQRLWLPSQICPELHLHDLANIPIHEMLRDVYAIPLVHAVETIEPAVTDAYVTKLMGLRRKTILLLIEHTTYTHNNKIVLFGRSFCRSDRYQFWVDLK